LIFTESSSPIAGAAKIELKFNTPSRTVRTFYRQEGDFLVE